VSVLLKVCWKKETAYHTTNDTLFLPPKNLRDSPPLRYRNKKSNSTARPKIDASKSASEHNFSRVRCNFRVSHGISPGGKQTPGFIRVFLGLLATLHV